MRWRSLTKRRLRFRLNPSFYILVEIMDPLHFCIAIAPLAVYMLLLGVMNLRGRPVVTTGARDAAALAIGLLGFVIADPWNCFFLKVRPVGLVLGFG